MKFTNLAKTEILGLLVIFLLAIVVRFAVIKNNAVFFFFDQARDATAAYQITHGHPIKFQGPSASGTDDSVYHGVLYYYLIAPAYALGHGNPWVASLWLGILTSLTIFPLYLLAKAVSKSSLVGYLAAGLFAVSFETAQMGTWLSNPGFAVLTLTCFYLFVWRIFYEQHNEELPWLALFLGLSNQSIIYSAYLWIILGVLYFANQNKLVGGKVVRFSGKQWLFAAGVYLLSISTMLINQVLLLKHGLFHPAIFLQSMGSLGQMPFLDLLQQILNLFLKNIQFAFFSSSLVLSILVLIFSFWLLKKSISSRMASMVRQFAVIWFLAPLALLLFVFRNGYHVMIGTTPLLYLIFAAALVQLSKMKLGKVIAVGVVALFLVSQFVGGRKQISKGQELAGLQTGTFLNNELALIDRSYAMAKGQPFSISTLTVPYGYNTTWAYLYHWYGQQKYGYLPTYVGPTQAGIPGGDFLNESKKADKLHFSIEESSQGLPQYFVNQFGDDQFKLAGNPSQEMLFGALRLQVRDLGPVASGSAMIATPSAVAK